MERDPRTQVTEAPKDQAFEAGGVDRNQTATEQGGGVFNRLEGHHYVEGAAVVAGGVLAVLAVDGLSDVQPVSAKGYEPAAHVRPAPEGFGVSQVKDGKVTIPNDVAAKASEPAAIRLSMPGVDAEVWPKANKPAETSGAHASVAQQAVRRHSSLRNQTILNKIHDILPNVDGSIDPKAPAILPTWAYLRPSEGGFRARCGKREDDKRGLVLRSYQITTAGERVVRCSPISSVWPNTIKPNQFKKSLGGLGNTIFNRSNVPSDMELDYNQTVKYVGGPRKKVTALYGCPPVNQEEASGVSKIVKSGNRVSIYPCPSE